MPAESFLPIASVVLNSILKLQTHRAGTTPTAILTNIAQVVSSIADQYVFILEIPLFIGISPFSVNFILAYLTTLISITIRRAIIAAHKTVGSPTIAPRMDPVNPQLIVPTDNSQRGHIPILSDLNI